MSIDHSLSHPILRPITGTIRSFPWDGDIQLYILEVGVFEVGVFEMGVFEVGVFEMVCLRWCV